MEPIFHLKLTAIKLNIIQRRWTTQFNRLIVDKSKSTVLTSDPSSKLRSIAAGPVFSTVSGVGGGAFASSMHSWPTIPSLSTPPTTTTSMELLSPLNWLLLDLWMTGSCDDDIERSTWSPSVTDSLQLSSWLCDCCWWWWWWPVMTSLHRRRYERTFDLLLRVSLRVSGALSRSNRRAAIAITFSKSPPIVLWLPADSLSILGLTSTSGLVVPLVAAVGTGESESPWLSASWSILSRAEAVIGDIWKLKTTEIAN